MQLWIAQHPEQYLWGYNRYKQPVAANSASLKDRE
jgi:lauroyl/myristoyl acyltransferase